MRYARFRRGVGACGDDAKIAIDLLAVGIDDRAVEAFGECERQSGFAARGRAGDDDDRCGVRTGFHRGDMVSLVLTMIAGRGSEAALPDCAAAVSAALPGNPVPDWLAPGIACDLVLGDIDFAATEAAARQAISDTAIDVIVQPTI